MQNPSPPSRHRFNRYVTAWPPTCWIERARSLIRGGASLAHTAASCGFADQSHMTRLFARQFGFTPGAWQQAALRTVQASLQ
ncbi:MAG: helix-turn-helix transcriptional regulator [Polaromonas sp.]|nr:helix-turn-helix transcriptional regulator [Polaromonas sp.]